MADTPPTKAPRKKPGKPMRFPERVLAHVTAETKQQLQAVADRRQLQVPDVLREYIRQGLERDAAEIGEAR